MENPVQEEPPSASAEPTKAPIADQSDQSRSQKLKKWFVENKKWTIPASVLLVLLVLAAAPWSRYHAAGLVEKKSYALKVTDATANIPVSGATVTVGSITATTNAEGFATLPGLKVGHAKASITKTNYKSRSVDILVPILKQKQVPDIAFTATGRQVKITVVNLVSKQPISGAEVSVDGSKSVTDSHGSSLLVVAAGSSSKQADVTAKGYIDTTAKLEISDSKIQENTVSLTPNGKIYFLSKLSGKIDVVKSNLDGSSRQTVLAGTGKEDDRNTVLLASRDWQHLALLSKRDGVDKIYVIDTSDDSLTIVEQTSGVYTLVGWSGDNFVYTIFRDLQVWQPHREALKSYNAQTGKLLTLDQTNAQGTDNYNYASESYGGVYEIDNNVVYEKNWTNYYAYIGSSGDPVTGKIKSGIYSIGINGGSPQTLKTFDNVLGWSTYILSAPYKTDQIYYNVTQKDQPATYYVYANGKVTTRTDIEDEFNEYNQDPITYLISPSGKATFWSESRDGKNTLFIGDQSGNNAKQMATLSQYNTYGWYTDDYVLVSKNSSELYIMPSSGLKTGDQATKITDYHKPATNFYGYGGGYGGL